MQFYTEPKEREKTTKETAVRMVSSDIISARNLVPPHPTLKQILPRPNLFLLLGLPAVLSFPLR